ncbi:hypothetical protein GCM10025859_17240 [Alicyclobacillus fastidiosus]|nr:hypothetical protein GCM10025859_17240 [Alicyclobacillus fastidiosus]
MVDSEPLVIHGLNKTFNIGQTSLKVLSHINLRVEQGEFITVIGPSGCGKSTLLKVIAGLDGEYDGVVKIGREEIHKPGVDKGFIFQEHRLFPWLTVEDNIAADLSLRNPLVREKVRDLIRLVHLEGFEKSFPRQLSGGWHSAWPSLEHCFGIPKCY